MVVRVLVKYFYNSKLLFKEGLFLWKPLFSCEKVLLAMHLLVAKLLSLTAIATVSLGLGVLPYHMVYWFKSHGVLKTSQVRLFLSAVICFSGGSMLGVAFLHLMPDMREKLASLGWEGYWESLPLSDTITCGGFFFVYLIDELMHMFIDWYSARARARESETVLAVAEAPAASSSSTRIRPKDVEPYIVEQIVDPCTATAPLHHETHIHHQISSQNAEMAGSTVRAAQMGTFKSQLSAPAIMGFHEHDHDPHSSTHPLSPALHVAPLTGLVTILAISFHDIFEGLAIGIEGDSKDVLFLYLSIAAHKYAIAFCIGMDLALSGTRPHVIILYMLTFSLISPLGILIGLVITAQNGGTVPEVHVDTPLTVTLQGLAGGTLIYVVCFEVLQREGSATHAKGIFNVIFVLIGFLMTLAMRILVGHSR